MAPYIDQAERERALTEPRTPGELNFAITQLLVNYVLLKGENYTHLNDCLGACEGAKQEFYRRVVAPYEDAKCSENGDVFPEEISG